MWIVIVVILILLILLLFQSFNGSEVNSPASLNSATVQYVVAFEDSPYMIWQAEVLLYNFQKLGISDQLWFSILYPSRMGGPSKEAIRLAEYHVEGNVRMYYNDAPSWKQYKAVCKSYGVAKLLEEIPQLGQCVFVMDADIILHGTIPFSSKMVHDDCIYGSDTNSYLSFAHFHRDRNVSMEHMHNLCRVVAPHSSKHLLDEYIRAEKSNSVIGAQYLFKNVDAAFFRKIAVDAGRMYEYALTIQAEGNACQIWVMGDMLSFLLNSIYRVGVTNVKISQVLDFSWATDPATRFEEHAICHMAGVVRKDGQFDKQRYNVFPPWDVKMQDFSYITNTNTCAQKWLEIIQEYAMFRYNVRMIVPCS
jgi:hypothetical protein